MRGSPGWRQDVDAFLRGDPACLASVENAVRGTVRSFRFRNADVDHDLVQETLSRTVASLSAGRFQGEASLQTFARNIARYTCLEHIRRRRQEVAFDPELHAATERWAAPETSFLSLEDHQRHLAAFASLPEDCRDILRMICLEGASYREVASRLGISEANLKSRVHRCRLTCRHAANGASRPAPVALRRVSS